MRYATIVLLLPLLLGGCTSISSDLKTAKLILPDVVVYAPFEQDQMAREMQSNACPALNGAMQDYEVMRDQTRAARK